MNSIAIRSMLKIVSRMIELRSSGIKLKVYKSELLTAMCDLQKDLPPEVNWYLSQARRSRSGDTFFHRLRDAEAVIVSALRLAEQMDAYHAEALEMNAETDRRRVSGAARSAQAAFEDLDLFEQWNVVDEAHTEALAVNAAFDNSFHRRAANWGAMDAMSKWIEIDKAHEEAIRINLTSAQDQAITQKLARRNSLSHKIGLAFAGAALVFSSLVSPVRAEVVPSYPVDASRMSLEGSVAVSIDCSARTVDVIRESTNAGYFSKQVKKQVANICHGEEGTLDRVYVFKMNKRVGAHDMMVNNTGRWTL